jgi:hypothetical protein
VLHLVGNALLLGLGYWWLGVGEADASSLALSAVLLGLFVIGATWLHATSLAYFRDSGASNLRATMIGVLHRLLPVLAVVVVTALIYFGLQAWRPLNDSRATDIASYMTLKSQKPVRPATIQRVFDMAWWVLLWVLLPPLVLPLASGAASLGWRGYREFSARWKDWRYWLLAPVSLIVAVWVPLKLIVWTPMMRGFSTELVSLIARFGLAYLLFVAFCLLLAFVTSRGRPNLSQSTTVVSP